MRAIYYPFEVVTIDELITIDGESAKHLLVARVRIEEEILLLNGKGKKIVAKVISLQKKSIDLMVLIIDSAMPSHALRLALGMPKKDAFEDIIKISVELGIAEIYPLTTQFSQSIYQENERIHRILESALIQSNNLFFPIIHPQSNLLEYLSRMDNQDLAFFNSRPNTKNDRENKCLFTSVLIGPEGGFSQEEEAQILSHKNVKSIHLPTPILRAPTAVASSIGYLLALENIKIN